MIDELKEIKKLYGEEMMHLCRRLFPTILEEKGQLIRILKDNIAPSNSFASDIIKRHWEDDFCNWIISLCKSAPRERINTGKSPFELMEEAGYILKECHNESDIQKYIKYYAEGEKLCTFNGGRLERCRVFFAVKKNADKIKREDFKKPEREDEYGTSVISIQFSRSKPNVLSIKNRYNHTVANPDATFSNNLENIIPGLTKSFESKYNLNIALNYDNAEAFLMRYMPYIKANDGKYYRYNVEINGIFYCENNIIIKDGNIYNEEIIKDKARYILVDDVIFDFKEKTVTQGCIDKSAFGDSINDVGIINKMYVVKDGDNKVINIIYSDGKVVKVVINKNNSVVEYINNYVEKINDDFLSRNITLSKIELNSVKEIGNGFLVRNRSLKSIMLPNVISINGYFMWESGIENVYLPNVEYIGKYFLNRAQKITEINLPKVKTASSYFMSFAYDLRYVNMPNVEVIGEDGFLSCKFLQTLSLPKVKYIGDEFLKYNFILSYLSTPNLIEAGDYFLYNNMSIKYIDFPKLTEVGYALLNHNRRVERIYAPVAKGINNDTQSSRVVAAYRKGTGIKPKKEDSENKENTRQV